MEFFMEEKINKYTETLHY